MDVMSWHPYGFGGKRTDSETFKREGWQEMGILVVDVRDTRLTWPEREFVQQLGNRLYSRIKQRSS